MGKYSKVIDKYCGEFAESRGEFKQLFTIANSYISAAYTVSAERWRVVHVFSMPC